MNNFNSNDDTYIIIKKKQLGRKRRNSAYNKYRIDNISKKLKHLLMNSILNFVNASLKEEQMGTNMLVKIDQNIIRNAKEYNLNLLSLTLKEIFSRDITSKIKKLDKNYNKKIIDEIYLNNRKEKIINILNMTLSQCIKHITKQEYYPELKGLENEYKNISNELKNLGETDEYIELFKDLFHRFEDFVKNKRKPNGNKKEENSRDNK